MHNKYHDSYIWDDSCNSWNDDYLGIKQLRQKITNISTNLCHIFQVWLEDTTLHNINFKHYEKHYQNIKIPWILS